LTYELDLRKVPFERQKKVKVSYKGNVADEATLDLVVDDSIIVEIKAQDPLSTADETKLKSFLRATKMGTGILVDFGRDHLEIRSINR
jgi:GxxExxY protein